MAYRIQIRRDTSTNWTTQNPTLAQGEIGLELDTKKRKIGDGTTAWNSLSYLSISNLADDTSTYPVDKADTLTDLTATVTELNYSDGVTSNIQTQLDGKLEPSDVINNVTTTTTDKPLSANMGKELQDEVNNLKNIGRFLAIWNSATGLPLTNPTAMPYTYKTGDYYRVGAVDTTTNYKPNGSSYDGTASTTEETESVEVGWVYYYDGTQWLAQSGGGGGTVQDVQVDGTSVVASGTGIANIAIASNNNLGVCKTGHGSVVVTNGGILYVNNATDSQITRRTLNMAITCSKLDFAVKTGITTNTLSLSDSEKTSAQTWLGTTPMNITYSDGTTGTFSIVGTLS